MNVYSILDDVKYSDEKPLATILHKSDEVNEMRIAFKKGQIMKAHKAPFKILVSVIEGLIDFGVAKEKFLLKKGDTIPVSAQIIHDLKALEQSIVKVTLIKK